jgi:hypothetical protein
MLENGRIEFCLDDWLDFFFIGRGVLRKTGGGARRRNEMQKPQSFFNRETDEPHEIYLPQENASDLYFSPFCVE